MSETETLTSPPHALEWMRKHRFGMFVHWGVYSLLGRKEWAMMLEEWPREEYEKLADKFTGKKFDANTLAALAKDAGMSFVCMTAKHHDGFCLFDSKHSDYTSAKRAAHRDFIAEFTRACRKVGLRVGLYYSLMDWHHPDWFALKRGDKAGHKRFLDYTHGQLKELMSNYGKIDLLFYDVPHPYEDPREWKAREMNAMVRKLQPGILINDRNCLPGDFSSPENHITAAPPGRAWQSCMTLNETWAYARCDNQWKTSKQIVCLLYKVAASGGSYLLNVGPRPDGRVQAKPAKILREVGAWLKRNGECVLSPNQRPDMVVYSAVGCSRGGHNVVGETAYIHATSWNYPEIGVGRIQSRVKKVTILSTGKAVKFKQTGTRLRLLDLPRKAPDPLDTVFKIEVEGKLRLRQNSYPDFLTGQADPGTEDFNCQQLT